MGFLEFKKQREQDRERIKAEDRLAVARDALIGTYAKAAREIVEHYNGTYLPNQQTEFQRMMVIAIEAGYEPKTIEDAMNSASKFLSRFDDEDMSTNEVGDTFNQRVRSELERGFSIEVMQS